MVNKLTIHLNSKEGLTQLAYVAEMCSRLNIFHKDRTVNISTEQDKTSAVLMKCESSL